MDDLNRTARPVILIGVNGYLGSELARVFTNGEVVGLTHEELDITDLVAVREAIDRVGPRTVINAAGLTDAGACEDAPERAFLVNALGPLHLAKVCRDAGCLLVHLSTDRVFDGAQTVPYVETNPVAPGSAYGVSKAAGELAVGSYCAKHYIVRTSSLYGASTGRGEGDALVGALLARRASRRSIDVVDDVFLTPTWVRSLAKQIHILCHTDDVPFGIVHATDGGQCSWHEFAEEVCRLTSTTSALRPVSSVSRSSGVQRPPYTVLANDVLERAHSNVMGSWKTSLAAYLKIRPRAFDSSREQYEKWPPMW